MNENSGTVKLPDDKKDPTSICKCVYTIGNVIQIPSKSSEVLQYASQTVASNTLTLISLKLEENSAKLTVNCEKMVIGSMLFKDLKSVLVK